MVELKHRSSSKSIQTSIKNFLFALSNKGEHLSRTSYRHWTLITRQRLQQWCLMDHKVGSKFTNKHEQYKSDVTTRPKKDLNFMLTEKNCKANGRPNPTITFRIGDTDIKKLPFTVTSDYNSKNIQASVRRFVPVWSIWVPQLMTHKSKLFHRQKCTATNPEGSATSDSKQISLIIPTTTTTTTTSTTTTTTTEKPTGNMTKTGRSAGDIAGQMPQDQPIPRSGNSTQIPAPINVTKAIK